MCDTKFNDGLKRHISETSEIATSSDLWIQFTCTSGHQCSWCWCTGQWTLDRFSCGWCKVSRERGRLADERIDWHLPTLSRKWFVAVARTAWGWCRPWKQKTCLSNLFHSIRCVHARQNRSRVNRKNTKNRWVMVAYGMLSLENYVQG